MLPQSVFGLTFAPNARFVLRAGLTACSAGISRVLLDRMIPWDFPWRRKADIQPLRLRGKPAISRLELDAPNAHRGRCCKTDVGMGR